MKKNKAAIFIAAGSALVLTVVAYLIWGKKTKTSPIDNNQNQNNQPNNQVDDIFDGGSTYENNGEYSTMPAPPTRWSSYKVNTSSSSLNVRNSPSATATIVGSLPKGSIIYAKPSSTSGWYEYSVNGLSSAVAGYVSSAYLIPA
jgi:hypothetical protein